jgi:hypothetical protein
MKSVFILNSGRLILKNSINLDNKKIGVIGKRNTAYKHSSKKNFIV